MAGGRKLTTTAPPWHRIRQHWQRLNRIDEPQARADRALVALIVVAGVRPEDFTTPRDLPEPVTRLVAESLGALPRTELEVRARAREATGHTPDELRVAAAQSILSLDAQRWLRD